MREWLGAMVAGGIVEYDPGARATASRPSTRRCSRATRGPNNLAATAQWVAAARRGRGRVLACFERGGGVPYAAYHRFHEVMAEESEQTVVAALFEPILPLVPGLLERLEAGIDVLDVGCGSGRRSTAWRALPEAAASSATTSRRRASPRRAPRPRDRGAPQRALRGARRRGPRPRRAPSTWSPPSTRSTTRRDPAAVLAGDRAALRPDGVFLMQDIGGSSHVEEDARTRSAPFIYTVSCLHCMTVSLAAGGAGLGAMWGEETARAHARRGGLREGRGAHAAARPDELLLRRAEAMATGGRRRALGARPRHRGAGLASFVRRHDLSLRASTSSTRRPASCAARASPSRSSRSRSSCSASC